MSGGVVREVPPGIRALGSARLEIAARLRARREEIGQEALNRTLGVSELPAEADPQYIEGLRAAVEAAVDYGIVAIEAGERPPEPPALLLAQAGLAARNRIGLETVLRRYLAGHTLFSDFVVQEAAAVPVSGGILRRLLMEQATQFDRLVAAVADTYNQESEARFGSPGRRLTEQVERLLTGRPCDGLELSYDLGSHHLAFVAIGSAAREALRKLATTLDSRLLMVGREQDTVWAWLGSGHSFPEEALTQLPAALALDALNVAAGGPARGLTGWRQAHREAQAALPVALRGPSTFVRYADVAPLAAVLKDEIFASHLRERYVRPLVSGRDGGIALRKTLSAYLSADRNVTSAAAMLGVSRQTVVNRLGVAERQVGERLSKRAVEFDLALRLAELTEPR
jgi:hypothetical protein